MKPFGDGIWASGALVLFAVLFGILVAMGKCTLREAKDRGVIQNKGAHK